MKDFFNPESFSDEQKRYLEVVCEDLYPQIKNSSVVLHLHSKTLDFKLGIELGMSILLNKPILVVSIEEEIPHKLSLVADKIIKTTKDEIEGVIRKDVLKFVEEFDFSSVKESIISPESIGEFNFAYTSLGFGCAIYANKPIFTGFQPGMQIPEKLSRIVDRFVEFDANSNTNVVIERIKQTIDDYENEKEDDLYGDWNSVFEK